MQPDKIFAIQPLSLGMNSRCMDQQLTARNEPLWVWLRLAKEGRPWPTI